MISSSIMAESAPQTLEAFDVGQRKPHDERVQIPYRLAQKKARLAPRSKGAHPEEEEEGRATTDYARPTAPF
jgi:hypothetical protein